MSLREDFVSTKAILYIAIAKNLFRETFFQKRTRLGATQAEQRRLGQIRVPDPFYEH